MQHWQEILRRQDELRQQLQRPITLRTAAVDYFSSIFMLENPILLDYRELKRLRQDAATDPLTGLFNRRLFETALNRELSRSRRYSHPLALLLIDLRNFKQANDTFGHVIGDQLLQTLARVCTESLRGSDYACRLGGDEFAILLPQSNSHSAHALGERIAQRFGEQARELAPGVPVGLDYGIASFPDEGDSPEALIAFADQQLYAYKRTAKRAETSGRETKPELLDQEPDKPSRDRPPAAAERVSPAATERRRHKRMNVEKVNAYGVLLDGFGPKVARVLDVSQGGVSFLLDQNTQLPAEFRARLNVPMLPAAQYKVERLHSIPLLPHWQRAGCRFLS